jgi:hypothetical protein
MPGRGFRPQRRLRGESLFQPRRSRETGSWAAIAQEFLMRVPVLVIMVTATLLGTGSARAQNYDPRYPVCLHVYGPVEYYECSYVSLPQCAASASGRSAQCVVNPYFADAYEEPMGRHHWHHRQAY